MFTCWWEDEECEIGAIQGLSEGRDVVISQALGDSGEVGAWLESLRWQRQPFTAHLKGIAGESAALRLRPPPPA